MRNERCCAWGESMLLIVITGLAAVAATGCERKERVLDVQTLNAHVKVDRNIDTGRVDVKAIRK